MNSLHIPRSSSIRTGFGAVPVLQTIVHYSQLNSLDWNQDGNLGSRYGFLCFRNQVRNSEKTNEWNAEWAAAIFMISSFSFSLGVSTACPNSHIIPLWLQLFCQLSLTMTSFILSAQSPVFETEYNASVLKATKRNDSCLPKTTSVTPLKKAELRFVCIMSGWLWLCWKQLTGEVTFCDCAS